MQVVLVLTAGEGIGRQWVVPAGQRVRLGRARDVDVRLRDPDASREHAMVAATPTGAMVVDLGGPNGTYLNGRRLPPNQPQPVESQSTLRIGSHVLVVQIAQGRPPADATPSLRDLYDIRERLGEGGGGTVYAARHRASGRDVAIKGLHDSMGAGSTARERFMREGRVRVQHPNVVEVLDVVIDAGRVYLVMERLGGGSVQDHLKQGPLPIPHAIRVGLQAARGLEACHKAGIIHRDIKPTNLLLSQEGVVKVADFGIAKQKDQIESLTATGQGMGTLAYISPEQARDAKRIGPTADLYSLGATLYHLVTGRPPFRVKTVEILFEIMNTPAEPLLSVCPECPQGLAELIEALLAKDPDERPPEAAIVVAELEALAG